MITGNPLAVSVRIVYDECIRSIKNSTSGHGSNCPNSAAVVDSHADITSAVALILALNASIQYERLYDLSISTGLHFVGVLQGSDVWIPGRSIAKVVVPAIRVRCCRL